MSYMYHSQTENDLKDCHTHHHSPSVRFMMIAVKHRILVKLWMECLMRMILKYFRSFDAIVDSTRYNTDYSSISFKSWVCLYLCGIWCRYTTSAVVLQEESGMAHKDNSSKYSALNNLGTKVMEGDWEDVECLIKENCDEELSSFILLKIGNAIFTPIWFISRSS